MADLILQDVRKTYPGGVEAVKGVSLTVPDGAFCVLVGPSGCGKSTLLRMVAGLETITSGTASIGGRIVNTVEPAERDIAMVFQNYALYPHMSVYDNMAYGLKNRGMAKAEIESRVREAARILAIEDYLARKPRALSGGQRQRVAMGRAIVRQPQVFLFDEPLSNLDAKLRVQMRLEIKTLQRRLGVTALYVTHDQVEAMTLSDMLVVMKDGGVEQIGSPAEVYRLPATRYVATFIGSPPMNILSGMAGADGRITLGDHTLMTGQGLPAPGAIEIGIRPEHVPLLDAKAAAERDIPAFPFEIAVVEELGASQLVHGFVAGRQPFVVQVASGNSVLAAQGGATEGLFIRLPSDMLHLFDPATGRRIAGL
jgi:sn-glycerol 3-phosphate transport system ATP-binding protein